MGPPSGYQQSGTPTDYRHRSSIDERRRDREQQWDSNRQQDRSRQWGGNGQQVRSRQWDHEQRWDSNRQQDRNRQWDDDDAWDDEDEGWDEEDDELWEDERATVDIVVRVLSIVGRVFITAGVLVLLFVAYQLWGTGIHESRAQSSLSNQFDEALGDADVRTSDTGSAGAPAPGPLPPAPAEGDAIARIQMADIGVDKVVVQGVSVGDLKRAPGHYPDSPLPGQPGNAAIAGHRTTYGAPFNRIDELDIGDEIVVTTLQGSFTYEVSEQKIVRPDQVEVLRNFGDNRLTLTACHPKYSARQRIVVVATLVGEAAQSAPAPGTSTAPADPSDDALEAGEEGSGESASLDGGLSGQRTSAWPAVLLGVACGLIWLAAWVASKLIDRWIAYVVGAPLFFLVLFFFYESFYRLLPANF
jgi:sortase A